MVTLQDLKEFDGLYYVGHLVDVDGIEWVDERTALIILSLINSLNS